MLVKDIADEILLSPSERKLFDMLPKDGSKINTYRLCDLLFKRRKPINARQRVNFLMGRIIDKAEHANASWRVRKSGRSGPNPAEYWFEQTA